MDELVKIFDTTLRDGEQSPGATMNVAEKVRIAEQLEKLNVDIIEAGFPISSEGDFEAVKAIARAIRRSEVAALARTNPKDIDRAWEAVKEAEHPRIHVFLSASDIHLLHQLKKSRNEILQMSQDMVVRLNKSLRVLIAITISSSEALPALSPMPLMVHSTCLAPRLIASRVLATAKPRSSWQ